MPTKTDFGDLTLYASTGQDAEETFLKFRTDIAGTNSDSNFNKIANILSSHDFSIKNARKIFDITATKIAENYYESNDFDKVRIRCAHYNTSHEFKDIHHGKRSKSLRGEL